MSVLGYTRNCCIPQNWAHAVNSLTALHAAEVSLARASEESPLGLEVDVRVARVDKVMMVPLLHHDPVSASEASACVTLLAWLEELADMVKLRSGRLGVVKLDFKEPQAATMTFQLLTTQSHALYSTLNAKFHFWWNADIISTSHDGSVVETSADDDTVFSFVQLPEAKLHEMIYAFVRHLNFGLSLGWRLTHSFEAYTPPDILQMSAFLDRLAAYHHSDHCDGSREALDVCSPACVTFPLRYSAVFGAGGRGEALCQLLDELVSVAERLFTTREENCPPCFLSFWRGRNEQITEEQFSLVKARFPTCTIDVD